MTTYEFGDIVLAPFPFTDQTASKKRPAVVVSSAAYHQERPDLIIMAVTSQTLCDDWRGSDRGLERSWSSETLGHQTRPHHHRERAHSEE